MRQYEKEDCIEEVKKGQKLDVGRTTISVHLYGGVDFVAVFGNPKTNNVVFVPFGSKIKIENDEYKLIKGEKYAGNRYCKTKEYTLPWYRFKPKVSEGKWNHSTKCLLDKNKTLHSLEDFMNKDVMILETDWIRRKLNLLGLR